jgi:mannitol-specific phosphotransferase system IIBC component
VKHFVIYTVLRLGLFLATYAVLSVLAVLAFGNTGTVLFVTVIVAAVVSSVLSMRLLAGPRERFAESVEARAARAKGKFEEMRSREDVD